MNNICIKPHIPKGEDGFIIPSSDSSVSVIILLLHSLPALLFATLLTTAVFRDSSNDGELLCIFRWVAGKGVFKFNSSSGLPTDSIITSPYKAAVFPSFYNMATFPAFYVTYPSPETFSLASPEAGFDACGNKGGDEEEEVMI